ncbi:hypothetical protein [Pseudophaeobacter sp.]|uniref:hypothetical protein n=1 Tax=Pseudophaeobacter sp. TaxID=1971739 RepID=UPI00329A2CCB
MNSVDDLQNILATQKAKAMLQDLEQAWAYFSPEAHPAPLLTPVPVESEAPLSKGFIPYCDAA